MVGFTAEEVNAARDSIGDLKAPGMDGLPATFYKHCWQLIGDDVVREVFMCYKAEVYWRDGTTP